MTKTMRQMIRLIERASLYEAPIGNLDFHGGPEPASLRAADIGIVTSAKGQAKIRRVLERAPVLIHLAFVNHPHAYRSDFGIGDPARELVTPHGVFAASGTMTAAMFQRVYGVPLTADPQALTVAFGFNDGDDTRPLTPWIIAHRIGHAVQEQYRGRDDGVFTKLLQAWNAITTALHWDAGSYTINPSDLAHAVGTWKSARDGTLTNEGEFVLEAFANFLVKGHVRLDPVGDAFPVAMGLAAQRRMPKLALSYQGKPIVLKDQTIIDQINLGVLRWGELAEQTFARVLQEAVGKIIVL